MTTTMYDSVTAADIPADAPMVAGYANGIYAWSQADWERFATPRKVLITVTADYNGADVLDVENGDATPADCNAWIHARQNAGYWAPTIYCEASAVPAVRQACAGLTYALWVAHYTGTPHQEPSAVATQYADPATSGGHYDLSLVADDGWPYRTDPTGDNELTNDQANQLTDIWNRTKNLEDVTTSFIVPTLQELKAHAEQSPSGTVALFAADIEAIAQRLGVKLSAGG